MKQEQINEMQELVKKSKELGDTIVEDGTVLCKALLLKLMEVDNRLKKLEARASQPLIH